MQLLKRLPLNTQGRDLIVGDIHGCFSKLRATLDAVGFSPANGDRLVSVGDMVDCGPESEKVLEWLREPWFHAVAGNHEDMAIMWAEGQVHRDHYEMNGGLWNIRNTRDQNNILASAFAALPVAIEIETPHGLVGVVHAECPTYSWDEFAAALRAIERGEVPLEVASPMLAQVFWGRGRFNRMDETSVAGLSALFVGHTPVETPSRLGNVAYIDTGAWLPDDRYPGRVFTIIDAATCGPAFRQLSLTA